MATDLDRERQRLVQAVIRDRVALTRFARSRLSSAPDVDAEDVVSDVTLRLFERADVLAQVEDLTAYLFRTVTNALIDMFRRRREVQPVPEDHVDPAAGPEAMVSDAELRTRLDEALARLSAPERAVWVAVEVEGWTFRELAVRWDEPIGTLLSRKNRATKALRRHLAELWPQGDVT